MVRVKVCGVTTLEDATMSVDAGADAIGLNFAPSSPRRIALDIARAIVAEIGDRVLTVGVFVDAPLAEIERVKRETGIKCVQLHGDESPELLAALLPHAYKALRVRGPNVRDEARRYAGEYIMLDAYVPGAHGGTGHTFDWALAADLARERKLALAGGLRPDNVAAAIQAVRPFCVDVASGVEQSPGRKDPELVRAFIAEARRAARG